MGFRINPSFLTELEQFGAKDIKACFNCGSCTAICPHSENSDTFPRRLIRYGQLGLKEPLVGSRELWLCYYCGECSDTCPREAEPGEFMAAARRYAIAGNDLTGFASAIYKSKAAAWIVFVIVSVLMGVLLLRNAGPLNGRFFEFIDGHAVHDIGIVVGLISVVAIVAGVVVMARNISRASRLVPAQRDDAPFPARFARAVGDVISEFVTQKRYRECNSDYSRREPWLVSRWFVHGSLFGGFIGLLFATTWDFFDALPDGAAVALTYPPRLVGTIAGVFFLYGSLVALIQRFSKSNKYAENSHFSDWVLTAYMFALALTGMVLLVLAYLAPATAIGNIVLLVHTVLAFQLVLILPFSKLAHAVYRTLAIFLHSYKGAAPVRRLEIHKPQAA